jgi:hypothetical protein
MQSTWLVLMTIYNLPESIWLNSNILGDTWKFQSALNFFRHDFKFFSFFEIHCVGERLRRPPAVSISAGGRLKQPPMLRHTADGWLMWPACVEFSYM